MKDVSCRVVFTASHFLMGVFRRLANVQLFKHEIDQHDSYCLPESVKSNHPIILLISVRISIFILLFHRNIYLGKQDFDLPRKDIGPQHTGYMHYTSFNSRIIFISLYDQSLCTERLPKWQSIHWYERGQISSERPQTNLFFLYSLYVEWTLSKLSLAEPWS